MAKPKNISTSMAIFLWLEIFINSLTLTFNNMKEDEIEEFMDKDFEENKEIYKAIGEVEIDIKKA